MISDTIKDIELEASFKNIPVEIDSESLKKDNIYVVTTEQFTGFIYVENKNENFIIFNNPVLKYAFEEGFPINHIYKCFQKKLFSFLTKEQFLKKLLSR